MISKKYEAIIFDLDGTLIDFDESERLAIERFFKNIGLLDETNKNQIIESYLKHNSRLWKHRNSIGIGGVFSKSIEIVCKEVSCSFPFSPNLAAMYLDVFSESIVFEKGAIESIRDLHGRFPLYLISNGLKDIQMKRIKNSGIDIYFEDIVVSGDVGFSKPDKEIFDLILVRHNLNPENCVYIGDSIRDDHYGCLNANLMFCLYDKLGKNCSHITNFSFRSFSNLRQTLGI